MTGEGAEEPVTTLPPRGVRVPRPVDARPVNPLLERQTHLRRRIVDAACALPFLGLLLWWLPMLWHAPDTMITTSQALLYIFAVWLALPVATGLLILAIRRASAPDRPEARK